MSNTNNDWLDICQLDSIVPNSGCCALVNNEQVAIFRISDNGNDEVYAIENYDPFSKANVISRGIVGSLSDNIVVASPIYKQHFCLKTGQCIEDEETQLKTWRARIENNVVQLSA
jgi:nitrite reductase (NADH) small subunit